VTIITNPCPATTKLWKEIEMKVIFVRCENDYDALNFEEAFGKNPSFELFEEIKEKSII
jgi:hypothetical protein